MQFSRCKGVGPLPLNKGECRHFFLLATFIPFRRASERPIAIACFGLVTFFPDFPDLSFPRFISCISRPTISPAFFEYLRPPALDLGI